MSSKLVSIIVPVYNVENYLAECLESILAQTYTELEILLVNDGSTDSSSDICLHYAAKDSRIKVINKENGGLSSARNAALQQMTGSFVSFVDSDDTIEVDMIEKLIRAQEDTDADIVVCGYERYDDATGKIYSREMLKGKWEILTSDSYGDMLYLNPGVWNKLYRKELFQNIIFSDVKLSEDIGFFVDIIKNTNKIARVREVLYHYRVRGTSIINTAKKEDFQVLVGKLKEQRRKIRDEVLDEDFQDFVDAVMFLHVGISVTFRLTQGDRENTIAYIRETKDILNQEFMRWRKSKYLSFFYSVGKGIKGTGMWGCRLLYKWNLFFIFVFFYRFIQDKLHVDIKW